MPEIDPNQKRALKSFRVIGFCTFAALAGALFGFDIGVISACFTMEVGPSCFIRAYDLIR